MTKKPPLDRRVKRTRRQLRESLVKLILDRGWDDVTVQDVCVAADVGRSTFYVHFADKEELLLSGFDDLHESLAASINAPLRGPFGFAKNLVDHAQENLRLFKAVIGKRSGASVQRRFRDVVLQLIDDDLARMKVAKEKRLWASRYISGGFIEMLLHWLESPRPPSSAELASTFLSQTAGLLATLR